MVANARPVSYSGGWMAMEEDDGGQTSGGIMYSPTATDAFGVSYLNDHNDDYEGYFANYNHLLKRWNFPDAQANIFILTGIGAVDDGDDEDLAGTIGMQADAEDRRLYAAYMNNYIKGGDIAGEFTQKFRVGIAPYEANYEDLATWFILEVKHQPEQDDNVVLQPMVRMFKGNYLWEAGVSEHGDILFNFAMNF